MFALVAIQGVRFSLRELLVAVAVLSCLLGGYFTYGVIGVSVILLLLTWGLAVQGFRTNSRWKVIVGIALSIPLLYMCGVLVVFRLASGIGPVYSQSNWPFDFRKIAEIGNVDPANAKIQCLSDFIDSEYVGRFSMTSDKLAAVVAELGLTTVSSERVPARFWQMFPRRWRPRRNENCRFVSTPNFPARNRGADGPHSFMMYDPKSELLYVWHKDNF